MTAPATLTLRGRWQRIRREQGEPTLRAAVLAAYTIDPLLPHLGIELHDAGLPVSLTVGPFNQIVQQCLDDSGVVASTRPDVLIVAPRFEELGRGHPDYRPDLLTIAQAARMAAARWSAMLVFILPAIPEHRIGGVCDLSSASGVVARAGAAREAARTALCDLPNVWLSDAEAAARAIGSRNALHPAMLRFAKIPYTEQFFAVLGRNVARLIAARFGAAPRGVVLDGDRLFAAVGEDPADRDLCLTNLGEALRQWRGAGIARGLRATGSPSQFWSTVQSDAARLVLDLIDEWVIDQRAAHHQMPDLCAAMGTPVERTVLITTGPALASAGALVLTGGPESWQAELLDAGLFDTLPPTPYQREANPAAGAARAEVSESSSLEDYVAGLDVQVKLDTVVPTAARPAFELIERAKDFTLGAPGSAAPPDAEILGVRVRDRLGDYGLSGAVILSRAGAECQVHAFSISCTVLGKGVEDVVLRYIVTHADRDGCEVVVFLLRATEHNAIARDFLAAAAGRPHTTPSGRPIAVRVAAAIADGNS